MNFISQAFAQDTLIPEVPTQTATAAPGDVAPMPPPVSPWEVMGTNMLMVVVLVAMFYVLLIMPQQRRMKEHTKMLSGLKKGDGVITAGGLIGIVDKAEDMSDEVVVDLGNGVKVTALRATIQAKNDLRLKPVPAAKVEPKKVEAKKPTPATAKKTVAKK